MLATMAILWVASLLVSGPGVEELFKADRAFSRLAAQKGARAAFLDYLADGAIIFKPEPVDAVAFYKEQQGPEGRLQWEPIRGDISKSQDLGYTTGPWRLTTSRDGKEQNLEGYYVSVWKKQTGGAWKVVLDAGVPTPPREEDLPASTTAGSAGSPPTRGSLAAARPPSIQVPETDDLRKLDAALGEATILYGALAAYQVFSVDDVRIYRPNELPLPGRERLAALVGTRKTQFETRGSDLSSTKDLGYTYGLGDIIGGDEGGGDRFFVYLHVWQKTDSGWRLALDLRTPLTTEAADRAKRSPTRL